MRYIVSDRSIRRLFCEVLLASAILCYGEGATPVVDQRIGIVNTDAFVAAHRTYPVGTYLKVANPENGMEILVKVVAKTQDLGKGEIIISAKAAKQLGLSVGSPAQVTIWMNGQTERESATLVFPAVKAEIVKETSVEPQTTTQTSSNGAVTSTKCDSDGKATIASADSTSSSNMATNAKDDTDGKATIASVDTTTSSNMAKNAKDDTEEKTVNASADTTSSSNMTTNAKGDSERKATIASTNAIKKQTDVKNVKTGDTNGQSTVVAGKDPSQEEKTTHASDTSQIVSKSPAPIEPIKKVSNQQNEPVKSSPPLTEKRWRVYLGAFEVADNAERYSARLRKDGFNTSTEKNATYTFVVITGVKDKDLKLLRARLTKAGYVDQDIQEDSVGGSPSQLLAGDAPTKIMGNGKADSATLLRFLKSYNANVETKYSESVIAAIIDEADAEGVNHDIAFIQMCQTTDFLRYGGLLTRSMNNFGGIGAVSTDAPGEYFDSIQEGVRAQIQHLKVYASREPLKKKKVDPRYDKIIASGMQASAEDIYGLAGKWATDPMYGDKLFKLLSELYQSR